MFDSKKFFMPRIAMTAAAAAALLAVPAVSHLDGSWLFGADTALAEHGGTHEDGGDSGGGSGGRGSGGSDSGGSHESGSSGGKGPGGPTSGGSHTGGSGGTDSGSGSGTGSGAGSGSGGPGGDGSGQGAGGPPDAELEAGGKPAGAGGGNRPTGAGGGPPEGRGSGDLYGDLWVVLRDVNGLPIYVTVIGEKDAEVLVPQPIDANGVVIPLDAEGAPLLVLRDYLDADGDGDKLELVVDPAFASTYEYIDATGATVTISVTYISANGTPVSVDDAVVDDGTTSYTAVQEVDLGRTNVSRAPLDSPSPKAEATLDNALAEALASIAAATSITFDEAGRIVLTTDGVVSTIDSPTENLALYQYLLDGNTIPEIPDSIIATLDLAAALLGAASDKEEPLDIDEVVYLNSFLEIEGVLTDASGETYYDYSTFTYDRTAALTTDGELDEVSWLEPADADGDGVQDTNEAGEPIFVLKTDTILNAVFDGETVTATNIDAFATAADDARAIIEFVHDNPVPTEE